MAAPAGAGNERTYSRPASRDDFEIAIICALPREMDAVELLIDKSWTDEVDQNQYGKAAGDTNTYELARIGSFNVVLVTLANMGKVEASAAAQCVATSYPNISLVLLVGVCGGMPFANVGGEREEIFLGDVVISSIVNQYDYGRQLPDRFLPKSDVEDTLGRPNKVLRNLLRSFEKVRARDKLQRQAAINLVQLQESSRQNPRYPRYTYTGTDNDRLFEASYEHKHHSPASRCLPCAQGLICESSRKTPCDDIGCDTKYLVKRKGCGQPNQPMVFIGRVGSADAVVRSAKHRDAHAENGIIALEMEGAGVWDVLPCLVIKGVCDYADSHKNKGWQGYAAATAASVAKAFLNCYQGTGKLSGRANAAQEAMVDRNQHQPPFSNLSFQADDGFIERGDITDWLQKKLDKPGSRAALYGFGGVGKSRLVIQYARMMEQEPSKPHIFWVHAGTRERFIDAYREIADGLKLEGRDKPDVDILKLVCNGLRHESKSWLMIVDNADNINLFFATDTHGQLTGNGAASSTGAKGLLPYLPRTDKGKILITTRSQQVAELLVTQVTEDLESIRQVTAMENLQAKQLLRKRLGKYHDDKIEEDLVNVLDCIPLAIIQAAAFIVFRSRNNVYSAAEYLEQFRRSDDHNLEHLDFHKNIKLGDEEASHAVLRTWTMTYEQIKQERSSAANLLSVLSFFHNQGIPEWVLEKYYDRYQMFHSDRSLPQDSPNPLHKDLDVLCGYSLVTVVSFPGNQNRQQPTSRSLQMHALVQTCTRHWLRSNKVNQQWLSTVTQLLNTAHPIPANENWAGCAEISPHVDSLLTFPGLERLDEKHTTWLVDLLISAAWYNTDIGTLGRAESLIMQALDVAEKRLCNPHSEIYLYPILLLLGRVSFYNDTLKPRFMSVANRYLASLINSLTTPSEEFGSLYTYMQTNPSATVPITSDPDEHTEQHNRVIMSIQGMKSSGFDNPTVLEVGHLERFILNAPFCGSNAHAFEKIDKIITVLELLRRFEDEKILCRALLRRQCETRLNEPDVDDFTLSPSCEGLEETVDKLCNVLIVQNKYGEAEDLLRMLILSGGHFPGHYFLLGKVLFKQKRFKEAEEMFRKELDLRYIPSSCEKDLTPQTFTEDGMLYYEWLGRTLALQGKHAEAVVCFRHMLEWSQQMQTLEHPDALKTYDALAKSLECLGEYEEAEGLHKHCVEICERECSHDHDLLSGYLVDLIKNLRSQGKRGQEEYQKFEDRLSQLGYELVFSDDDDSCKELDSGGKPSSDGNQSGSEEDHSQEHRSEELQVESTSKPVDPTTMATSITVLAHDYGTMNLTSQNDERHHQGHVGKSDKPLLNHDDSTPTERDRQLEESGVEIPVVETQAESHEGNPLTSTSAMQEQCIEMPTQWIQVEQGQGSQIRDEPEDMQIQVISETLESAARKRKRADTRDSVITNGSMSTEQPSRKVARTE